MPATAHQITATGIADALCGRKPIKQTARQICASGSSFTVLVIPEGEKIGDYYIVGRNQRDALLSGVTPRQLGIHPMEDEPFRRLWDTWDRDFEAECSRADRENDERWEGVR
jgi:hypothetical protein